MHCCANHLLPREGCRSRTASWPQSTQNELQQGCKQWLDNILECWVVEDDEGYDNADDGVAQSKWYAQRCCRNTQHYQELQAP